MTTRERGKGKLLPQFVITYYDSTPDEIVEADHYQVHEEWTDFYIGIGGENYLEKVHIRSANVKRIDLVSAN